MKRRIITLESGQEMVAYYFPQEHRVSIRHGPPVGNEGIMRIIEIAGSCVRCGAFCLMSQWDNHIRWHTNAA